MQHALRRFRRPSPLGVVFAVTLAVLVAASYLVVAGVVGLLDFGSEAVNDALPFVERLF